MSREYSKECEKESERAKESYESKTGRKAPRMHCRGQRRSGCNVMCPAPVLLSPGCSVMKGDLPSAQTFMSPSKLLADRHWRGLDDSYKCHPNREI